MRKYFIFLLVLLFFKTYGNYITNKNESIGNKLDILFLIYLRSRGNKETFIRLKERLLPMFHNMYENVPDIKPFSLPFIESLIIYVLSEFTYPVLHILPFYSKQYVRDYGKLCIKQKLSDIKFTTPLENAICIHVRCSDVPFVRHNHYLMHKCEWYRQAIQMALEKIPTLNNIIVVSCHSHRGSTGYYTVSDKEIERNSAQCEFFIDNYIKYLTSIFKMPVKTHCGSLENDMYIMHYSPCLIASTGSFAYYMGYCSDNFFITSDKYSKGHLRNNMHIIKGGTIKHHQVNDYYNKNEMSDHLACNI